MFVFKVDTDILYEYSEREKKLLELAKTYGETKIDEAAKLTDIIFKAINLGNATDEVINWFHDKTPL